jgi:hypothetical protein
VILRIVCIFLISLAVQDDGHILVVLCYFDFCIDCTV